MSARPFTARRHHYLRQASVLTLTIVLALAGIGSVGLSGPVGVASAQTSITGCTIIDDPGTYELTQNITDASGTCIEIRTSDVVFDGNGFTIDGASSGDGVVVFNRSTGLTNVTVRNLTVTDWEGGIFYNHVLDGAIHEITAQYNNVGIALAASSNNTITNNTLKNNGDGLIFSTTGLFASSYSNTITNNIITQNHDDGIFLRADSEANTVANNIITQNHGDGIDLSDNSRNTITNNIITQNHGDGIDLFASDFHTITNNTIAQNTANGINLIHGFNHMITNNTIVQNTNYGIRLSDTVNNTIANNTIAQNTEAGIRHAFNSDSNLLYNNYLNNTVNVDIRGAGTGTWNVSKQPGPNIIGGPFLGGNYYATPDGTGYSQTCTDANGDGFCDHPNDLGGDNTNIDYLPLTRLPSPTILVSPPTVEFGTVTVGESSTATVSVTNTRGSTLTVSAIDITGPNASAFSVTNGDVPFTLGPGENSTLTIQFAPASQGEKTATLRVESADADMSAAVGLSGRGRCPDAG